MVEEPKNYPNYQRLLQGGFRAPGKVVQRQESFFVFTNADYRDSDITGWKLHISVDGADVPNAWNVVAELMDKHNISRAKVATPETINDFNDPKNPQAGKMITIYDYSEPVDWQRFITDIEEGLTQAGVKQGPEISGDKAVNGSRYIAYRNDGRGQGGEYIFAAEKPSYNPTNVSDPWQNLDVSKVHAAPDAELQAMVANAGQWQEVHSLERYGVRKMSNTGHRIDFTHATREETITLLYALDGLGLTLDKNGDHPDIQRYYDGKNGEKFLVVHAPSDKVVAEAIKGAASREEATDRREDISRNTQEIGDVISQLREVMNGIDGSALEGDSPSAARGAFNPGLVGSGARER